MKNKRRIISILLSITIIVFFPILSISQDNINYFFTNNQKEEYLDNFSNICLTPGENETMLNFCWYSKCSNGLSKIKIWEDGKEKIIYKGKSVDIGNGFVSNKATVKNLKPNSTYFYSYECDGIWSEPLEYETKDFNDYSFVFVTDPQIGASSKSMNSCEEGVKKDAYNWNKVIKKSLDKSNNISFIICGGDETNTSENDCNRSEKYTNEWEYSGFLSPCYLRQVPIANAIGNHDKDNLSFYNHFNMPNLTDLGKGTAGADYYFVYGNALYLFINTNNLNISEHKKFINEAVKINKNIKWKIAVFHHDIYGGGRHRDDKDIKTLREKLPPILESNNIDLALCGHDHIYSRTYPIKRNKKIKNFSVNKIKDSKKKIEKIKKNKGVIYITGSSCTGSKFYKQVKNKNKYIKKRYNKEIPTYTVININQNFISIITYEINNDKPIDNKLIIHE